MNKNNVFENLTYNGLIDNPLTKSCYYCYILYDIERQMYYSGVKINHNTNTTGLLDWYFTSSTIIDFRERLKSNTKNFISYVEYFVTAEDAFNAEKIFHHLHKVSKRSDFYNAINASGSLWGAGSVLCQNADNSTYRVSIHEYQLNKSKHKHISNDKMNVVILATGKKTKINCSEYDSTLHLKQWQNKVKALNLETNLVETIDKNSFDNSNKFVGVTKNRTSVFDILLQKNMMISSTCQKTHSDRYVGPTSKLSTNKKTLTLKRNGRISTYSISERKNINVAKDIYDLNKKLYLNHAIKRVFIVDNKIYTASWKIPKSLRHLERKEILKNQFTEQLLNYTHHE